MRKSTTKLTIVSLVICVLMAFERNASAFGTGYNPDGQAPPCSPFRGFSYTDIMSNAFCIIEGAIGAGVMVGAFFISIVILFLVKGNKKYIYSPVFLLISVAFFCLRAMVTTFKPVIYLYPEKIQDISVRLDYSGKLTTTYPSYDLNIKGWNVTAHPDGKLIDLRDNKEYSYLFWEGVLPESSYKMPSRGFIVRGEDSAVLLQKILAQAGLKPVEYNELIVFWYPQIKDYPFVQIAFAGSEYEDTAKLTINPKPDSILRIFLYFKKLSREIVIEPQTIPEFQRKGFSVVEWGGTVIP